MALFAKAKESIPENETAAEQRERLREKARRMMFNEKGVAYAPWMVRQFDEDVSLTFKKIRNKMIMFIIVDYLQAMIDLLIKKESDEKVGSGRQKALGAGEKMKADVGALKWRLADGKVDIGWQTDGEASNQGFIVEKRPASGGDFQEISSFRNNDELKTCGPKGGR